VSRLLDDWETRFRAGDAPWERGDLNPAFIAWRDAGAFAGLANVLLPGGGRAPEARAFAALGIPPTVVDLAPTAVEAQRDLLQAEGLPGEAICGDVLDWAPEAAFDAVYEQTAMCALPPGTWQRYAANLHRWLRSGGRLFALFVQKAGTDGPPYHQELARMRELFPVESWHWPPDREALTAPHPAGIAERGYLLIRR